MATDIPTSPSTRKPSEPLSVTTVLLGSAILGLIVGVASVTDQLSLVLAVLVVGGCATAALMRGIEPILVFFCTAVVVRPLVDITATQRGSAISITEAFGGAVLVAMVFWLLVHRHELAPRLVRPIPLALISMVAVSLLATLGSTDLNQGFAATSRVAAGLALFLVTDLLLHLKRITLRQLMLLILATSVIPLVYPILGVAGVEVFHQKDGVTALKSVFFLSNNFAYFLMPMLVLGVAWVLRSTGWQRIVGLGYVGVVGMELLLAETRGAWLGTAVAVLIVTWILDRRVAILSMVGVVLMVVFVPSVNARLTSLADNPYEPRSESSLDWRFGQWDRLLPEVLHSPVLGGGPGEAVRLTTKEAHNDYLRAAVETGLIGFAAYLFFLGAAIYTAWRAVQRVRSLPPRAGQSQRSYHLLIAVFTALAAHMIAVAIGSAGENLIDNVTFLWSTLPLLAIVQWSLTADPEEIQFS
ncbi:hypothetical protein GCM10027020_38070 [Nocardioides salsibiostraticola]